MTTSAKAHDATGILEEGATVEEFLTGFTFTEGPVWHPYRRTLVFSDIPRNLLYVHDADGTLKIYRDPSYLGNGNAYDRDGRLLTCEHATSRVTRENPDGTAEVLASHHEGRQLNSPNDIVVASDGSIYFTDPQYGRFGAYGIEREPELPHRGVYRITPAGELELVIDDFDQPNGLCLSLDETRLFVNDTERRHIRAFDVGSDGVVSGGDVWAELPADPEDPNDGKPDGMKLDSEGNLYCTGPHGIRVYNGDGGWRGTIPIPEHTANFNWGDDDLRTLFVTASTTVYRVRVQIPGLAPF